MSPVSLRAKARSARCAALPLLVASLAACSGAAPCNSGDGASAHDDAGMPPADAATDATALVDAATPDAAAPDAAPAVCSTLPNTAPRVVATRVMGPPPTPMGGRFEYGTYFVTARTGYTSADAGTGGGDWERTVMVMDTDGRWDQISEFAVDPDLRHSGTFRFSGMLLLTTLTCGGVPSSGEGMTPYSVVGNDVLLFDYEEPGVVRVTTLTRQP